MPAEIVWDEGLGHMKRSFCQSDISSGCSFFFNHVDEFIFVHDFDLMARLYQISGFALLGGHLVWIIQQDIILCDHEEGHFLGNAGLNVHSSLSGNVGEFRSGCFSLARKANCGSGERTVICACLGDLLRMFFGLSFVGGLQNFCKRFAHFVFGEQDDHRRRIGIFAGVVVIKLKAEVFLEICQSVSAVSFEVWPCFSGDLNAINPIGVEFGQAVQMAGHIKGSGVKIAMLDERVSLHQVSRDFHKSRKTRFIRYIVFINPVKINVEFIEELLRIYEVAYGVDCAVAFHHSQTDLADAVLVGVGGFNIDRDEPEVTLKQAGRFRRLDRAGRPRRFTCFFGRWLSFLRRFATKKPSQKSSHQILTFGLGINPQSVASLMARGHANSPHAPRVNQREAA